MKFDVHLLWRAARDLDHIVTWLYERSPQGAEAWHQAWKKTFRILQTSAGSYGLAPESEGHPFEIRQILFSTRKGRDYRALYTIQGTEVYIMHIRAPKTSCHQTSCNCHRSVTAALHYTASRCAWVSHPRTPGATAGPQL